MKPRKIKDGIYWLGAADWDRRLFDALIPLPDGTSYNAYLAEGSEKTAILDSVDPEKSDMLMDQLRNVDCVDYIISHHAEQDHSGAIPALLSRYPGSMVVTSPKGKSMLMDHLHISDSRFITVEDGQELPLGGKTLRFIYTPWVHWPETMCTYVPEDGILFSCDFFGSHIASSEVFISDQARVLEAAKRYYAEIMAPFRSMIKKNIDKLDGLALNLIAPSHGPVFADPAAIIGAYREWISDEPKNLAVLPYVSMHGSTRKMVEHLVSALSERGVEVQQFELTGTDLGKLAMSLVDAATIIIGTPTVHAGPHPAAFYAAFLANTLRPKARFASIIGSYGWKGTVVEKIAAQIPHLKVELIDPVLCKGAPGAETFAALDTLADSVARKHREAGLLT